MHLFSFVESLHRQERAKEFHSSGAQQCIKALGSLKGGFWFLRVHVYVP